MEITEVTALPVIPCTTSRVLLSTKTDMSQESRKEGRWIGLSPKPMRRARANALGTTRSTFRFAHRFLIHSF
jgi:hypothetical protein